MWEITAKKSIGEFNIGDDIKKYIEKLGEYTTFKRFEDSDEITYTFYDESVHLTCDENNTITNIAIFDPNEVSYLDIQLLNKKIAKVKKELISKNIKIEKQEDDLWIEEAGVLLVEYDGVVDCVELC